MNTSLRTILFASVLLLFACGKDVDPKLVREIQSSVETINKGKTTVDPVKEKAAVLSEKLKMVPKDLHENPDFVQLYNISSAIDTKNEMILESYTELENKMKQLEEEYKDGKRNAEDVKAELDQVTKQLEGIEKSLGVVGKVADSLSTAYDKMAASATGPAEPVVIPDAAQPSGTGTVAADPNSSSVPGVSGNSTSIPAPNTNSSAVPGMSQPTGTAKTQQTTSNSKKAGDKPVETSFTKGSKSKQQ